MKSEKKKDAGRMKDKGLIAKCKFNQQGNETNKKKEKIQEERTEDNVQRLICCYILLRL